MQGGTLLSSQLLQVSSLIGGSAKAATPAEVQRFRARSSVGEAITTGDIDSAMSRLRQCAPGLLESQPQLLFQLRCQKLVELVRPGLCCSWLWCVHDTTGKPPPHWLRLGAVRRAQ